MNRIDLNSDVGESFGRWELGDDLAMFQSISSANVACGFHAGDPTTMRRTCDAARLSNVVVGAHPSYRDRAGFGRRFIDVPANELTNDIIAQVGALQAMARTVGTEVRYVKLHGALYNATVRNIVQASAVVEALANIEEDLPLLVPPGSVIQRIASDSGIRTVTEAYADRAYSPEGTLLSRREEGSVIHETRRVVENVMRIVGGEIIAVDGTRLKTTAETICLHSDTSGAVELSREIRAALDDAGVEVRSFLSL